MKKISTLIILSISIFSVAFAQDWQCIHDSTTSYYLGKSNDLWAVRIDSIANKDGYIYYYGFHINRQVSDSSGGPDNFYCFDPNGPSRMGIALSVGEAGNFFFNSAGDGIRFRTDLQANVPWICCRISDSTRLDAVVTLVKTDTVLGLTDSVKYISFQAKRNTGEPVSHPLNNQVFKVSKTFGMITLYDFFNFPAYDSNSYPVHNLSGISSHGTKKGTLNLTSRDIYSMAPGDEFHIFYMSLSGPHGTDAQLSTVKIVLDSTWNPTGDTVRYKCLRLMDSWLGTDDDPHRYSRDTIVEIWSVPMDEYAELDNLPEQAVFKMNSSGVIDYITSYNQYRNSLYNFRWVKESGTRYEPCSFCADGLVGSVGGYFETKTLFYNIGGCGSGYYKTYWTDWYSDSYTTYNLLRYFRKGSETWGTPFDTTNWIVPNSTAESHPDQVQFLLYPNPVTELLTVEISHFKQGNYRLVISSLPGSVIDELNVDSKKFTFNVSKYSPGMYFYKVYLDNKRIGGGKFVKH